MILIIRFGTRRVIQSTSSQLQIGINSVIPDKPEFNARALGYALSITVVMGVVFVIKLADHLGCIAASGLLILYSVSVPFAFLIFLIPVVGRGGQDLR